MKERPILFNGEMVRAVLAGQKTQTRRIPSKTQQHALFCPYGHPGDRLWVQERWATDMSFDDLPPRMLPPRGMPIYYHATAQCMDYKWRPSIHMPRWAALIWAALTFVEDACNTCPVYARRPEWRYLCQTVNTLAERLRELEPRMDEEGTAIYEEAA